MKKAEKKIFGALALITFSMVTGIGMAAPIMPLFAKGLGAGSVHIGLIFCAFYFSKTIFLPYFGKLSDLKDKKTFIVFGLVVYALVSVLLSFVYSVSSLLFLRFVHGIASAMTMAASQAYIGEIAPKGREGSVMGLFTTCVLAGLCLGPIMGGAVSDHLSIRSAFMCMGILAFISAAIAVFMLPDSKKEISSCIENNTISWKLLIKDNDINTYCIFRFSYAAAIGAVCSFLPIFAVSELNINHASTGVLVMIGILICGISNTPMGMLADKLDRRFMVVLGGIISVTALMSYAWADDFSGVFTAGLIFGLGGGIAAPALMALVIDKGKNESVLGSVNGLLAMSHSFGMMTGALCGGIIMGILGVRYVFLFNGLLMLMGVFSFIINEFRRCNRIKTQDAIAMY